MKNGPIGYLLSILAFAVAYFAVKYGIDAYQEYQAAEGANEVLSELQSSAMNKHPDLPLSVAMQQEATRMAEDQIAEKNSDEEKADAAANMFWGYYFLNARERLDFCEEKGINIQSFVRAFKNANTEEYALAESISRRSPISPEKLYSIIQSQLQELLLKDMQDIASANGLSLKGACTLVADNADLIAAEMKFSKNQSAVYQALVLAQ